MVNQPLLEDRNAALKQSIKDDVEIAMIGLRQLIASGKLKQDNINKLINI